MSSLLLWPWLCFFSGSVTSALYVSGFPRSKPATAIHLYRIILLWFKGLFADVGILEEEGALFKNFPCQGLRKSWALDGKSPLPEISLPSTPAYKAQSWSPEAVDQSGRNRLQDEQALGMQSTSLSCRPSAIGLLCGGLTAGRLKICDSTRNH